MAQILIKGMLLKQHFKNTPQSSFYIYQFQISDNNGMISIINIYSKQDLKIDSNKEIELPINISLNANAQIVYEFNKGVKNG